MSNDYGFLVNLVAYSIITVAIVAIYKILEKWWKTKSGKRLLKALPFNETSIKGVAIITFYAITLYSFACVAIFLHDL